MTKVFFVLEKKNIFQNNIPFLKFQFFFCQKKLIRHWALSGEKKHLFQYALQLILKIKIYYLAGTYFKIYFNKLKFLHEKNIQGEGIFRIPQVKK